MTINPISKIDAVRALYGRDSYHKCTGDGEVTWKDDHETTAEETAAIDAKYIEVLAEYDTQEYARNRATAFPSIGDQLDMQYHDEIDGTTTWKDAVAKVKSDNPKE